MGCVGCFVLTTVQRMRVLIVRRLIMVFEHFAAYWLQNTFSAIL